MKYDTIEKLADDYMSSLENYSDALDARIVELMNTPTYDPLAQFNFAEAIDQLPNDQWEIIREYAETRQFENFGRAVWSIAMDYWEKSAETEAQCTYGRKWK